MSLAVSLLGKPRVERDGELLTPPRGRKAWALLAYLILSERPLPRSRLASLLFAEADDPLGALRWSLAELRRLFDDPLGLRGDPLVLRLPADTDVDALALLRPREGEAAGSHWEGELLEGMDFPSAPAFETWLTYQRRHLAGTCQALIHEAALERLAAGDAAGATELAARLVALDPLESRSQELLIRSLARGGDRAGAEGQLAACAELFERELGVTPGPELRLAARESDNPTAGGVGDRGAALGQLEAGRAALAAGAVDPGLECLRLASAEAAACGDAALWARSLAALGSALVHVVRSRDQEGAAALHQALALAEEAGERDTAALACRELGYIDVQVGRGPSAGRWLDKAAELSDWEEEMCAVLGVRGMALSDHAYYPAALELLEESIGVAEGCGQQRQAAWSLSLVGRIHLLRGDPGEAIAALDRSIAIVDDERWTAFRPWPESLRAEASMRTGNPDRASERLKGAFSLACRLGDPCWEGTAARALGLLSANQGDTQVAREWLADALSRVTRVSDPYEWVHAHVLDATADFAVDTEQAEAEEVIQALRKLAERTGMREFVVRAHIHDARRGVEGALEAAGLLAGEIDNPALEALVQAA